MRAASVGPHIGERDLLRRALLEKQLAIGRAEKEGREGPVEKSFVYVLHEMAWKRRERFSAPVESPHNGRVIACSRRTCLLVERADGAVVLVDDDAALIHEPRLLDIVRRKVDGREVRGRGCG